MLSGGTSSRFGADKSQAILGHKKIIEYVLSSIPIDFQIIVVGPDPLFSEVSYECIQENPRGGGPVAGIAAALEITRSDIVGVLATDMPFALSHMLHLLSAMSAHDEAVMFVDSQGFRQPLAAFYRIEALEKALIKLPQIHGASMRALISGLAVHEIHMSAEVEKAYLDVDTPHDLAVAIEHLRDI